MPARQTTRLAGLDATVHSDLTEWRYGSYTAALMAGRPEADDPWWSWQQATGGQRNMPETLGQLVQRADGVLKYIAQAIGNAVAIVVSHGHVQRVLMSANPALIVSEAA